MPFAIETSKNAVNGIFISTCRYYYSCRYLVKYNLLLGLFNENTIKKRIIIS